MSQIPQRTRVRQPASSAGLGREVDGYANLIAARLRKLAAAEGTGMLPVSGAGDGAFFLHGGLIVHAESSRTTSRRISPERTSPERTSPERTSLQRADGLAAWVTGLLSVTELIIDAATDLLSSESRYAKFRQADVSSRARVSPISPISPIPVTALLAEVERRHHLLRQLAEVVTADTRVVRNGSPDWPLRQVSRPQWALVMGIADGRTPRSLAMELGRSVFATTVEIYRLIMLGLLAVPGNPPAGAAGPGEMMPFTRAMDNGRGSDA